MRTSAPPQIWKLLTILTVSIPLIAQVVSLVWRSPCQDAFSNRTATAICRSWPFGSLSNGAIQVLGHCKGRSGSCFVSTGKNENQVAQTLICDTYRMLINRGDCLWRKYGPAIRHFDHSAGAGSCPCTNTFSDSRPCAGTIPGAISSTAGLRSDGGSAF